MWLETNGANGERAILRGANLEGANLRGANLAFTIIKAFYISKYFGFAWIKDKKEIIVKIGCLEHNIDYWLKNVKSIGQKYEYSKSEIDDVRIILTAIKKIMEKSLKRKK